jgi:hypothetical protein
MANPPKVHMQIGFIAETFFTPETTSVLAEILEPQYSGSVGRAAAWADAYAHTTQGRFSYQWHWIDTHDAPPHRCSLDYFSDCAKGGCVVSAIANQTGILGECIHHVKSGALSGGVNLTCSYALKWVAHFLGDIHQPLHASGRAAGGNFYKVKFGNVSTELHAVRCSNYPDYNYQAHASRSGMATSLIMPRKWTRLSRTHRSIRSSPTSLLGFERTSPMKSRTRGLFVATL